MEQAVRKSLVSVACDLCDDMMARGLGSEDVAYVALLLRAEAYRRVNAAKKTEAPAAGKIGLGIPIGIYRGLVQPKPEEPAHGQEAEQQYRVEGI
jgi:hypothetical protein